MDQRLINEIAHGKTIGQISGKIWYWETPAGKERWKRRVEMLTSHITPQMKVLEVGCGTGYLTKNLKKKQATIFAIDISSNLLDLARKKARGANVTFLLTNAYNLGFRDNSFDTIVGSVVLHHLEIDEALKEFYRVLKVGGSLFFTEPNMMNPQIAIQKNIPFIKKSMGDSKYETAFFRWRLKKRLAKYGFRDIKLKNFDFLHPRIPKEFVPFIKYIGNLAESIPVISEIAGSIYIEAKK